MNIIVHPAATADLNNAAAFYSERANKQLGLALIAEFEKAVLLLSGNPELGVEWVSGTRRSLCAGSLLTSCIVFFLTIFTSWQLRTRDVALTTGVSGNK